MYNTKFILENQKDIYPGYLDKEKRKCLREKYDSKREYMKCGCNPSANLFYRISEDLKIYPEHKNYVHDKGCSRYIDAAGEKKRHVSYIINEEDGEVTAYISFNPKEYSRNEEVDKIQDNDVPEEGADMEQMEEIVIDKEEKTQQVINKEPKLSLAGLIRSINVDTYTDKVLNDILIKDREAFSKSVYFRMKKIHLSRTKKTIGDLNLQEDGVRFFYLPFGGIATKSDKGFTKSYIQTVNQDGSIYNNFIYPEILEREIKKYTKRYGIEPDENTMVAGFQYIKKGKAKNTYRVLGRIHLFQVSNLGIYCRNILEENTYNQITEITKANNQIKFWIPPEDEEIGGIIQVEGKAKKILLLFKGKQNERVTYDGALYIPWIIGTNSCISTAAIYELYE